MILTLATKTLQVFCLLLLLTNCGSGAKYFNPWNHIPNATENLLQQPMPCPDFGDLENGNVKMDVSNQIAILECNPGYHLDGVATVFCQEGLWDLSSRCHKQCEHPPLLPNGHLEIDQDEWVMFNKGTLATYSCKAGFELYPRESRYRVCEKGIWTGGVASCIPRPGFASCPVPKELGNGYFVFESPEEGGEEIYVGQRLHYSCKDGYVLNGATMQQCLDDGTWSPKIPPVCRPKIGVINMCFMLLFRDLIRLFACYNDGIINLLEKYFEMNKKQCREALDLYKKFLIRMDRVGEFLKVAENIGIDKGDIPDLTRAPNSLLDALEQHLASLEGNTPTTAATNQKSLKSGVNVLANTSNAFGSVEDSFQQAAVAEEEAALNQYKAKLGSPAGGASTNPFLSEEPAVIRTEPILDLFGEDPLASVQIGGPQTTGQPTTNALDDLLGLGGNPFADFGGDVQTSTANSNWANGFAQAPNGSAFPSQQQQPFGGGNLFNSVNEPSVFDPMGGSMGEQMMPMMQQQQPGVMLPDSYDARLACVGPPIVPHSVKTLMQGYQSSDNLMSIPGTVIQINCLSTYRNAEALCQPGKLRCVDGKWIGTVPVCVKVVDCGPPPPIPYGDVYPLSPTPYESLTHKVYHINSKITYKCIEGFALQGDAVFTCSSGGCWFPVEPPTCYRSPPNTYFPEVSSLNAILVSAATGAGVLGLLLVICLVTVCRRRKPVSRSLAIAPPAVQRPELGDHATLLHHPDRLALIAFADGMQNDQGGLPTYDEATRERTGLTPCSRLYRPHWPGVGARRSRNAPNPDLVPRHGSLASHTPSTRSAAGDSMGSTDTVAVSEGSTNVTLDTVSSLSGSQPASCRVHCGSLASFDTSSVVNTEGVPLLEESELEEIQGGDDNISLVVENTSITTDNGSLKLSTHSSADVA